MRSNIQSTGQFGPANFANQYSIVDNFNSTYWDGLSLRIYLGRQYLVDAIQFNYQVLEQTKPYFGYASHVSNKIHHGTRLIMGEFTLNFTTESYFYSLLDKIRRAPDAGAILPKDTQSAGKDVMPPMDFMKMGIDSGTDLTNLPNDKLRQFVENYRKSFRNDPNQSLIETTGQYSPIIPNKKGIFQTFDYSTGMGREMDLTLVYGVDLKDGLVLNMLNNADAYYADKSVTYNSNGVNQRRPITGLKFIGTSIVSQAKSIDDSGRPIVETYSFQARNIQVITNKTVMGNVKLQTSSGREYLSEITDGLQ